MFRGHFSVLMGLSGLGKWLAVITFKPLYDMETIPADLNSPDMSSGYF